MARDRNRAKIWGGGWERGAQGGRWLITSSSGSNNITMLFVQLNVDSKKS